MTQPIQMPYKKLRIMIADDVQETRRTDDQASEISERLARDPQCELRWLMNLAMLYAIRKKR